MGDLVYEDILMSGAQYIDIKHVFTVDQSVELLQDAYDEAERLRDLAWGRVEVAMFAASPIKAGDLVRLEKQYSNRDNGKILRVKSMAIRHVTYEAGRSRWEVRADLYPVKKDGTMAKVGSHDIWNVTREYDEGKIVLVPEIINTK